MACKGCYHTITTTARFTVDRDKVKDFLVAHGVIKGGIICPDCSHPVTVKYASDQLLFRCGTRSCRRKSSAKSGTFVEGKLPLDLIISFVSFYLLGNKPFYTLVEGELPISKKTISDWSSYCREVCIDWVIRESAPIGGEGVIVEVGVAKFGEPKEKRGREVEGQLIFGGVEHDDSKKFCLVPIDSDDKNTLLTVIEDWILPGSIVVSDWKAYDCYQDEEFLELKAKHSFEFLNYANGNNENSSISQSHIVHTNMIELKWRSLRESLPLAGRKKENFTGYLAEHIFMCKVPREQRMHNFFLAAGRLYPPP